MLRDTSGRTIKYLRLSLTPACPLKCLYCRPAGPTQVTAQDLLQPTEIETLVAHLAKNHGLTKVRLTGGDPTSRFDLIEIIGRISGVPEIKDLALTTHGLTLSAKAHEYKKAGLQRVNVSLDTLDIGQFKRITGTEGLARVLAGIHAAQEAGLNPVRINTVVMRGENEDQLIGLVQFAARHHLEIRFIELMPMGPLAASWRERFVPERHMRERLDPIIQSWHPLSRVSDSAQRYRVILDDGHMASLGFVSAMSGCFCADCNRVRVTSNGSIFSCLMGRPDGNILPALRPQFKPDCMDRILTAAIRTKNPQHPAYGTTVMTQIGG